MLGLGSGLAASDVLFSVLKWLGAGYLAYLGIVSLLSTASTLAVPDACAPEVGARALFARGMLVGASNPKALLFFGALFPQFIEPSAPQAGQSLVLGAQVRVADLAGPEIRALLELGPQHGEIKSMQRTL
jgi:threonine/homoserine/homoserine lactone efflux protein